MSPADRLRTGEVRFLPAIGRALVVMAACVLSGQIVSAEGTRVPASKLALVVGRETTVITEPLTADGYPDYISALNFAAGKDVAREDNFWAQFFEVTGRGQDFSDEFVDAVNRELQIRMPDQFQIKRLHKVVEVDRDDVPALYERLAWAMTHPWRRDDAPAVEKWLEENKAVMEGVQSATRRPNAYCPLVPGRPFALLECRLPHVNQCRICSQFFAARAMQHLKAGRARESFDDALTIYRIAGHLDRGSLSLERVMAAAHRKAAHEVVGCWLAHCHLSREEIHEKWAELKPLLTNRGAAVDTVLPDRYEFLDIALAIASGAASHEDLLTAPPPPLDPFPQGSVLQGLLQPLIRTAIRSLMHRIYTPRDIDAVLSYGNDRFNEIATAVASQDLAERAKRCAKVAEAAAREKEQLGTPTGLIRNYFLATRDQSNLIPARMLFYVMVPARLEMQEHLSEDEARSACVAAAFLLQADIAAHGSSPDRMNEMIRSDRFPKDPYAATPLKVQKEEHRIVVYSVGANGRDDSEDPEDIEADDVRFTIGIEEE